MPNFFGQHSSALFLVSLYQSMYFALFKGLGQMAQPVGKRAILGTQALDVGRAFHDFINRASPSDSCIIGRLAFFGKEITVY